MLYSFDNATGVFHCSIYASRCQITVLELETLHRKKFIITTKNKNFRKFLNAKKPFIFEGNIISGWTPVLKNFKLVNDQYPEYLI